MERARPTAPAIRQSDGPSHKCSTQVPGPVWTPKAISANGTQKGDGTPAGRAPLIASALATGVYAYVLTQVNLPEEWLYWIGGGVLLGATTGSWHALLCSLAPVVFAFTSSASGSAQEEVNAWLVGVYVPGAFVAILAGLAARRATQAIMRRRRPAAR